MKRIRWLRADWTTDIWALVERMREAQFTREVSDGFLIERARKSHVDAFYIEKRVVRETVVNPFGESEVFEQINYLRTEFSLADKYPQIQMVDYPRNPTSLLNRLLEASDFSLSVETAPVNVLQWARHLSERLDRQLRIQSMQVADLDLGAGVTAKILVRGDSDVTSAIEQITGNRKYRTEKVRVTIPMGTKETSILLAESASAQVSDQYFRELIDVLKSSLPK